MVSNQDKLNILTNILLPQLEDMVKRAAADLVQYQKDYIALNHADGGVGYVKKLPIMSAIDARVHIEMAQDTVGEIKRLLAAGEKNHVRN